MSVSFCPSNLTDLELGSNPPPGRSLPPTGPGRRLALPPPNNQTRGNNVSQGQEKRERKVEEADQDGPDAALLGGEWRPYGGSKGCEADQGPDKDLDLGDLSLGIRPNEVGAFDPAISDTGVPEADIGVAS
jgi:hypothetical protein